MSAGGVTPSPPRKQGAGKRPAPRQQISVWRLQAQLVTPSAAAAKEEEERRVIESRLLAAQKTPTAPGPEQFPGQAWMPLKAPLLADHAWTNLTKFGRPRQLKPLSFPGFRRLKKDLASLSQDFRRLISSKNSLSPQFRERGPETRDKPGQETGDEACGSQPSAVRSGRGGLPRRRA
jgi:hypothetical protein